MQKFILSMFLVLPSVAFGQTALTTAQIAKRVSPTVVVIQGKTDSGELLGSGFIVSKDGKIVTNLHVIRDLKTASVLLANGRTLDSVFVLATDERRDLAIIHISGFDPQKSNGDIFDQILDQIPQRSQVLELGDSDNVTVGNQSVGHPGATFLSGDRWGYRLLLIKQDKRDISRKTCL
jgi:S1-C subfamily serine protease